MNLNIDKVLNCSCGKKHLVEEEVESVINKVFIDLNDVSKLRLKLDTCRREIKSKFRESESFLEASLTKDLVEKVEDIFNSTYFLENQTDIVHFLICDEQTRSVDVDLVLDRVNLFYKKEINNSDFSDDFLKLIMELNGYLISFNDQIKNTFLKLNSLKNKIVKYSKKDIEQAVLKDRETIIKELVNLFIPLMNELELLRESVDHPTKQIYSQLQEINDKINDIKYKKQFNLNFEITGISNELNSGPKADISIIKIGG